MNKFLKTKMNALGTFYERLLFSVFCHRKHEQKEPPCADPIEGRDGLYLASLRRSNLALQHVMKSMPVHLLPLVDLN